MKKILSAYGVNELGLLYYAGGLPTASDKITLQHHKDVTSEMIIHKVTKFGFCFGMDKPETQFIFPFLKSRITITL